ncbi:hypothetical protein PLICRDRAFT_175194 [Plicaturopsis crispa FD-325 SS-3]|nr:hypothetical protein PLICRDRAFT_175194 [Plicaturopsis crispa FD-325 SS-3]
MGQSEDVPKLQDSPLIASPLRGDTMYMTSRSLPYGASSLRKSRSDPSLARSAATISYMPTWKSSPQEDFLPSPSISDFDASEYASARESFPSTPEPFLTEMKEFLSTDSTSTRTEQSTLLNEAQRPGFIAAAVVSAPSHNPHETELRRNRIPDSVPPQFRLLVDHLDEMRSKSLLKPPLSLVSEAIRGFDTHTYEGAGAKIFDGYIEQAVLSGVLHVGEEDGRRWVALPSDQSYEVSSVSISDFERLSPNFQDHSNDNRLLSHEGIALRDSAEPYIPTESRIDQCTNDDVSDLTQTLSPNTSPAPHGTPLTPSNSAIAPLVPPIFFPLIKFMETRRQRGCLAIKRTKAIKALTTQAKGRDLTTDLEELGMTWKSYIGTAVKIHGILQVTEKKLLTLNPVLYGWRQA